MEGAPHRLFKGHEFARGAIAIKMIAVARFKPKTSLKRGLERWLGQRAR
jgi:hypothetical protein